MKLADLIDGILKVETDKFTNDPSDSGGPTKWGITQATLSEWYGRPATIREVAELSRTHAYDIYAAKFYFKPAFDKIAKISTRIAEELTDTGVNCGVARAGMFLQRALNAFNLNASMYPDVDVDGACGEGTRNALKSFVTGRGPEGETVMLRALNCLQGEYYIDLAEKRPKDEKYVYGWLLQRVVL